MRKIVITLFLTVLNIFAQSKIGNIISPTGGVYLTGDSSYTIRWTNNVFHPQYLNTFTISIDYSTNSGTTFTNIIANLSKVDSVYKWNVPALNIFNVCKIRIIYKNSLGQILGGDTSATFSIDSKPFATINLLSPNNGAWVNTTPTIKWSASGFSSDADSLVLVLDGQKVTSFGKTATTYTFTSLLTKGWHSWTIRVIDARKNYFQPVSIFSFRVDNENPFDFSLISPSANSYTNNYFWSNNQENQFKWLPSADTGSGLKRYYYYLDGNIYADTVATSNSITFNKVLFYDDFEAGLTKWTNQSGWGLVSKGYYSGSTALTESPAGNYSNNLNTTITSSAITLKNIKDLRASYWCSYKLEKGDNAYFEISFNGSTWQTVATYNGYSKMFQAFHNLTPYVGSNDKLYIRFRVNTNSSGTNDGFIVDDIKITNLEKRISSGNHNWYIAAEDSVGNIKQSSNILSFIVDSIAPVGLNGLFENMSPVNNLWTRDSLFTFNWLAANDNGSGLEQYQLWINNNLIQDSLQNNQYTISSEQKLASGTYTWKVKALDNVKNEISTTPFSLNVDYTPPKKFNLLTPSNNSFINIPTPTFTWQASADSGIGLSKYQLVIDNQINIDSIEVTKTQTTPNPANLLSEGIHTWYVKAFDKLNNQISSNDVRTIVVDWTAPIIPTLTYPLTTDIIDTPFPTFKWLPTTDNLSGVSHYNLYLDNKLIASNIPNLLSDTIKFKAQDSLKNGSHTWYILAYDKAGNFVKSEVKSFTASIDYTPPVAQFTNIVNNQVIGGNSYLISGTASDNVGGVGLNKIQLSFDGGKNWIDVQSSQLSKKHRELLKQQLQQNESEDEAQKVIEQTVSWEFNWQAYSDGIYDIRLRAIDKNNNIQNPVKVNVIVDKTLPTIQSINIANKYINAGLKNISIKFKTSTKTSMDTLKTVNVEIITYDNFKIYVQKTGYALNTWTGEVNIPDGAVNGKARIKVYGGTDKANNVMLADSSITFYIDTQAPTAPILIKPKNQSYTNNLKPRFFWLKSTDTLSGIDHYELEINGSTLTPGKSWISPNITDTLPTNKLNQSTNIWRIKVVDKAGNFIYSQSANLLIDTLKPTSIISTPANGSVITQYPIIVSGTASDLQIDPFSGIDSLRVRFKKDNKYTKWYYANFDDTLNKSTWQYKSDITDIGTYYVEAVAVDKAGNVQNVPAVNIFTINLGTPNQIYPDNNATNIPKYAVIKWSKGLGAKNYHLQVALDNQFTQMIYNDSTLTDTSKTLQTLQNNNSYYWRIRSRDGSAFSNWSSVWKFTTRVATSILYTSVDTLKFGNIISKDSLIKTFIVKNVGDDTLKATLTILGTIQTGFKYKSQNITLKPFNDSTVISVKFVAPTTYGLSADKITISYNSNSKDIILTANVIPHPLQLSVDTLKFDEVNLNTISSKVVSLNNNGNEDITISSVGITGSGYSITSSFTYPLLLKKGTSINFTIAFNPTQLKNYIAYLDINSNKPKVIAVLTGTGYKFQIGADSLILSNLTLNYGRSFNLKITPTGLRNGNIKLMYKKAGDLLYDSLTFTKVDSLNYSVKLDSTKITLRGLMFYLKGTNGTTVLTMPQKQPEFNPFVVNINLNNGITAPNDAVTGTNASAYRMISIPVNNFLGLADTIFGNFAPSYDPKKYRLFQLIDTQFVEYDKGNFTRLTSGKGYWFITKVKAKLKSGKGSLYPVNKTFQITLQPGYNVIGNPYNFDITWNDVSRDSTKVSSLYTYDGKGFKKTTILKPWEGYIVKNLTKNPITVSLIPRPITIAKQNTRIFRNDDWSIKLELETKDYRDDDNYFGALKNALDEFDKYDEIKPLIYLDQYLYLYSEENNQQLSYNFKKSYKNGYIWKCKIKAKDDGNFVKLTMPEINNLPDSYKIILIENENNKIYDLRSIREIIFKKQKDEIFNKSVTLLVGDDNFINQQIEGKKFVPKSYELMQNYPNPFNPETNIKFMLPEKSSVQLKVYNILGQEVATLVNEVFEAGEYLTKLNINNYGLSSGVYIYRIVSKSLESNKTFNSAKKLVIIK